MEIIETKLTGEDETQGYSEEVKKVSKGTHGNQISGKDFFSLFIFFLSYALLLSTRKNTG